jgi:hypothetical protein
MRSESIPISSLDAIVVKVEGATRHCSFENLEQLRASTALR